MSNSNGNGKILSGDNPFPLRVPGIERSALNRNITKEQAVDIATRIAYGMCQQLFEVLNTKHTVEMELLAAELRKEIHAMRLPRTMPEPGLSEKERRSLGLEFSTPKDTPSVEMLTTPTPE